MGKRLINEEFVKKWESHLPLIVDHDAIITPSAYEAAMAKGLRVIIRRESEGVAREKDEDSAAVLTVRLPRRDGVYLIKVQGGAASILDVGKMP